MGGEMQGSDRETRGRCLMPPAVEMQKQSQIQILKKMDKVQKVSDQNGWNIYPNLNNQWCCCLVWSHKRLTFSDASSVWIVEHLNLKIRQGSQLVLSQNLNQEWRLFGMGSNTKRRKCWIVIGWQESRRLLKKSRNEWEGGHNHYDISPLNGWDQSCWWGKEIEMKFLRWLIKKP